MTYGETRDASEFMAALERVRPYEPVLINSQSDGDRMSFDEGRACFETALRDVCPWMANRLRMR